MRFQVKAIKTEIDAGQNPEIVSVRFDLKSLKIELEPEYDANPIVVSFEETVGFRVLDEGDLLEFWNECSLKDGWLYHVEKGGWFDLESTRDGFVSQHNEDLNEYLIVGVNDCVSVLSYDSPKVA